MKSEKEIYRSRSRSREVKEEKPRDSKMKKLKWVMPGIIVRVVSEKIEKGRLYNCKLRVTDVLSAYQFLAVPLSGTNQSVVYDELREKDIETVMPKQDGEQVAILRGEFKGEIGKMLSRDRKKDEVVIQVGMVNIVKVS